MYGDPVHLTGDLATKAVWRRVDLESASADGSIDEDRLQDILFRHANLLPLDEIDPAYDDPVPVCRELETGVGPADLLYLTPKGRIVLAEVKLWRNPEARRKVVGQILDYAKELASWGYTDLDRVVKRSRGKSLFDIVSEAGDAGQEHRFVDRVSRNLKRGEFLLLIIGDGIHESVEKIVSYMREHGGLRFDIALVEAALFRRDGSDDLIILPRVPARTQVLSRTVLVRKTILEETDDDPLQEHESKPTEDANERFWKAVLRRFEFDDAETEVPHPTGSPSIWVMVPDSGALGGLWFAAFVDRRGSRIGTYLSWRKGTVGERIYNEVVQWLEDDEDRAIGLDGWERWTSGGKERIGFRRHTEFADGLEIRDFPEAVDWMRDHFNRLVSTLHPECRRRLRRRG